MTSRQRTSRKDCAGVPNQHTRRTQAKPRQGKVRPNWFPPPSAESLKGGQEGCINYLDRTSSSRTHDRRPGGINRKKPRLTCLSLRTRHHFLQCNRLLPRAASSPVHLDLQRLRAADSDFELVGRLATVPPKPRLAKLASPARRQHDLSPRKSLARYLEAEDWRPTTDSPRPFSSRLERRSQL